eukprot:4825134-Pyramimonas_sp.AAC.1
MRKTVLLMRPDPKALLSWFAQRPTPKHITPKRYPADTANPAWRREAPMPSRPMAARIPPPVWAYVVK